jgi:5-methylthioadenosine/S-adenosylhomocysteine deaminase
MKIRIYNVRILTMEENKGIFRGEVWVEGDTIIYAGPIVLNTEKKWDKEIDGQGNLLMPGFKNAHTHSAMTFLRSHADDMKLDEWLNTRVFPAEAQLTGEDIYWLNKLAIMEYLTSGITAAFDMYIDKPVTERVALETGFRTVICESINNYGGTLEQVESDYKKYNQDAEKMISYQLGFHAEYTTSRELMEGLAALSEQYQIPVYVHCSETRKEVEDCRDRTGMTPIAYMDSLGLFNFGGGLFHGVHLDEEDFDIVKKRKLYVVTNPASNLKLASGIAPVKRYLDMGIPVAIGTDGPASNNCLDMFREMFLTTGLQKAVCDDPEAVPAMEVLKMATVNGAQSMGLSQCDIIAEGKKADMILIDLQQPNMQPIQNIERNLVYSGSKQNVKMTMVAGKILYLDGEYFLGSSKEEIFAKANESARRILG